MTENEKPRVVWPTANLPTTAAKWVRTVQKLLTDLSEQVDRVRLNTDRALKTLSLDLGKSTRTVNTLVDVVAALPVTRVFSGTVSNFNVPGAETTQLTLPIEWEEGKTKCDVFAVASAEVEITRPGIVVWRINIGPNNGTYTTGWNDGLGTLGGMAKASASVTSGQDFNVVLRSSPTAIQDRVSTNFASLDVIAVFS